MKARVCIVRHRRYPHDARIANQVQALLDAGCEVDVLCMWSPGDPLCSRLENGAWVVRLPSLARKRGSSLRYIAEYGTFFLISFLFLGLMQIRRQYRVVHVCTLPDFLVFAALMPKAFGAKIVLDLRECTPEFYHIKFGVEMDSALMKAMIALEQHGIRFADAALTCTEQMRQRFIERGADPDKIFVMMNAIDPELFNQPTLPDPALEKNAQFRMVMHGTITRRYGHDILIRAMVPVLEKVPQARLEIMGRGEWQPELEQLVETLGLGAAVTFAGYLPVDELIDRLRAADCGVVPMPQNVETDLIHTYKMQEYMALGIPVIISRLKAVEATYDGASVCFFEPGNELDLARAIIRLYDHPRARYDLAKNALKAYETYGSSRQRKCYTRLVQTVLANKNRHWSLR